MADNPPMVKLEAKAAPVLKRGAGNFFVCPECDAEHAFSGHKPGEPLMCPKCAIPLKAKYTK
jgi:hypothetical protein